MAFILDNHNVRVKNKIVSAKKKNTYSDNTRLLFKKKSPDQKDQAIKIK